MALQDIMVAVSGRNTEAVGVAFALVGLLHELAMLDLEELRDQGIVGRDLLLLYNACCNEDVTQLHAVIVEKSGQERLRSVPGSSFYVEVLEE